VPRVPIDDPRDPRIAHFVGLRDRELARRVPAGEPGVFIAEGDIVAERAIRAGYAPRAVLVDATRTDPLPAGIGTEVSVYAAAPAVLQRITGLGVHRGLLACFDRRPPRPAAEVLGGARRVVVLERVSNPTNLGVILRSAAGLGMDAVLLDPTCSDPLYRRTARVAMGEGYGFPWAWVPRLPAGLDVLRAHGFSLIALTPDAGAVPVDQLPLDELSLDGAGDPGFDRVALLFGAEGPGLSPETLAAADVRAGIPMRGGVDSLNVGVAAGIAFWVLGQTGSHRARRPGADGERTSADT
jgi:tRNA G18 (ribose-2'-O)-methylase SpoU